MLPPLLQVKQGVDLPQWLAYASSSLTFGGGLLGISYGIMSGEDGLAEARGGSAGRGRASWDCIRVEALAQLRLESGVLTIVASLDCYQPVVASPGLLSAGAHQGT